MDGIVDGRNSKECSLILLNPSLKTINVPRGTIVGNLTELKPSELAPIEQVLQVHSNTSRPRLTDVLHLANI